MGAIRLFNNYLRTPFLVLGITEAFILLFSVYGAVYLRFSGNTAEIVASIGPIMPRALLFTIVMMLSMVALGLYQARLREGMLGVLLRTVASFMLGGMILSLLFYILPFVYLGRGALVLATVLAFFIIGTIRPIFFQTVDESLLRCRVLVVGVGQRAASINQQLRRRSDRRGFNIIGFVPSKGDAEIVESHLVLRHEGSLLDLALEKEIDEIVVAVDDQRGSLPMDELLDCKFSGLDIIDLVNFFEREAGKVRLDLLNPSWMIFSDGFNQTAAREIVKRGFDISACLLILLVTWPLMLITALAIMREEGMRAPIIYRQMRVGQGGHTFELLKFRSMVVNAEADGQAQWAEKADPRLTKVGAFIRKFRIDELPQAVNVLRGQMSFIGPRPERPSFVDELSKKIPHYAERHRVKPGITGWAQLHYPYGSSEKDAREKLQFDLYYAKNHSLLIDMLILLQTVEVVLLGRGSR